MTTPDENDEYDLDIFYNGPERRHANAPRRHQKDRRYRHRKEALLTDCRSGQPRRREDEEGFIEIANLYPDDDKDS